MVHLWLRAETKADEHRAALTPNTSKQLIQNGSFKITVEKSTQRIFDDEEYERIGCTLVQSGTWKAAPSDTYIIGLKELPENDDSPLSHTHIYFAHCYKNQSGWQNVLKRFINGKGLLLDLEFLNDEKGRRVAAFGYHAGFAGAAIGLDVWAQQILHPKQKYPSVNPYPNEDDLIKHIKNRLNGAVVHSGVSPRILIMGALGRCGKGACDISHNVGMDKENIIKWDIEETKKGGPFSEILDVDIFVNCIYLSQNIPPFITKEMLDQKRNLSVIVDVSCDITNPNNPVPVYNISTTFKNPTELIETKNPKPLEVISIDHLPTLLPKESSEQFSKDLLPSLLELQNRTNSNVWLNAEKLFVEKVALVDS
ncbi:3438_t:CDS:2 [Entrophospora sp. SA101]|nr:10978_t:CDS:2 [Entrophospora sp. SA101]CAJ0747816.1 19566_t:CDS:2 [Entrophospora sp. SA101]CAJ0759842.1 3438_t:CDS:2 [Entrophospora sp. SA101]CAJ0825563.1 6058_t:CDS:2 [Entrophospora sp. SA101]CAJ0917415.1 14286_t:CDS:2 [Entrophospora sp. SA101]